MYIFEDYKYTFFVFEDSSFLIVNLNVEKEDKRDFKQICKVF